MQQSLTTLSDAKWTGVSAVWDGRSESYIPRRPLRLDSSVRLSAEAAEDIDPITYQVLRSRFWHINLEHSDTIKKVSGSPVVVWSDDFNVSLLTEEGDIVVSGPDIQYFTGLADLIVKWTLEHRGASPGIHEGDVFLQNDPFIGAPHQPDTSVYAPLFWNGQIFCWVFNCCHVGDIGGVDPGSFCVNATDIWGDPTPLPPIKLVRGGELQLDVLEMFARQSRVPAMVALQLRSQVAGIHATQQRLVEIVSRYGAATVKGVMRRMIADCSRIVGDRLSRLPDGSWSESVLVAGVTPTDRSAHREVICVRKVGDRVVCSNEGTDAQWGAGNSTFSSWRSALLSSAAALLAYDQLYCVAGVAEHLEFEPIPGTRNVASYPASISALTSTLISVNLAYLAMSKMLLCGPEELRQAANAAGGLSLPGWWMASGHDRQGRYVADSTGDSLFGAIGAFTFRDGVSTGGAWWFPRTIAGNAEEWEQSLPILYLYRRERRGSGGPGRWRGGNGAEIAIVGHKTTDLKIQIVSSDPAVNTSRGLGGGYPGHSGNHRYAAACGIDRALRMGHMPASQDELVQVTGEIGRISPQALVTLGRDDVLVVSYCAGGGIGDPLLREPARVAEDVREGHIDADAARRHWGVIVTAGGCVDEDATERERAKLRKERLAHARAPATRCTSADRGTDSDPEAVAVDLGVVSVNGNRYWACCACARALAPLESNYKRGAGVIDTPPHQVDADLYPDPSSFCDEDVVLRQYICPHCAHMLATEFALRMDEPVWDLQLS